jgi:hypothetical protein
MLIKREKDGKVIMVSRQKVRVHESIYVLPLSAQQTSAEVQSVFEMLASSDNADAPIDSMDSIDEGLEVRPETDNNMVLSVKSLKEILEEKCSISKNQLCTVT